MLKAKVCSCVDGFIHEDGQEGCLTRTCSDDVGCKKNEKCVYNAGLTAKVCSCERGFIHEDGQEGCLTNCDCGDNGECNLINEQKHCQCNPKHVWDKLGDGTCKECYCGDHQENCSFVFGGKKKCYCQSGYKELRGQCQKFDDCWTKKKCGEYAECDSGICKCKHNFKNESGTCKPDFCSQNKNQLCPNMECKDREGKPGEVTCFCKEGTYFTGKECKQATKCDLSKCEQNCDDTNGACSCYEGYELNADNITCSKTEDNTECSKSCGDGGFCIKKGEELKCKCGRMHTENEDGTCIDLCKAKMVPDGMCPQNNCESVEGNRGFRCNCTHSLGIYELSSDGVTCKRKDMCQDVSVQQKCKTILAHCNVNWSSEKGYVCVCPEGYQKDGKDNNICKKLCDLTDKKKECADIGGKCFLKSSVETDCACQTLFVKDKSSGKCTKKAPHSYTTYFPLVKKDYYKEKVHSNKFLRTLLEVAHESSPEANINYETLGIDVRASMEYVLGKSNYLFADVLRCTNFGSILNCTVELKLKNKIENKDLSFFSMCSDEEDSCVIPPKLIVDKEAAQKVKIEETDPCSETIKNAVCGKYTNCTRNSKFFECVCMPGFRTVGSPALLDGAKISSCEDINECDTLATPCADNTVCNNTVGDYECHCVKGYRKQNDNVDLKYLPCIAVCSPTPCQNGGTCSPKDDHSFHCSCPAGYTGELCDKEDNALKQAKKESIQNSAIIGSVLGALFLITAILAALKIRRMKKKVKDDDFNTGRENGIPTEMRHMGGNPVRARLPEGNTGLQRPKDERLLRSGDSERDYRRERREERPRYSRSYDDERRDGDVERDGRISKRIDAYRSDVQETREEVRSNRRYSRNEDEGYDQLEESRYYRGKSNRGFERD